MKLVLVKDETEEEINLESGNPVIIGRGSLPGCSDKKVSRNHGELQLTPEGNVRLKALHTNPCFVMKNGLPPIIAIMKNNEKVLSDGDYIGLLPDTYWYKVVIKGIEGVEDPGGSSKTKSKPQEDGNKPEIAGSEAATEAGDKSEEPQPSTSGVKTDKVPNSENDKSANEEGKGKYNLEERLKALEHTKKLPLDMYNVYTFAGDSEGVQSSDEDEEKIPFRERIKKNKGHLDQAEIPLPKHNFDGEEDEFFFQFQYKEPGMTDSDECGFNVTNAESARENGPHTSKDLPVDKQKENGESSEKRDAPSSQNRPICQYEGRCYRKNDQHKKDFCHPGDPDYIPYENRPMCAFGASCYRRNKNHRIEYRHPKENGNATELPAGKRRRREGAYRDAFDDDSEPEDPFKNDGSSDEFVPSNYDTDEEMGNSP